MSRAFSVISGRNTVISPDGVRRWSRVSVISGLLCGVLQGRSGVSVILELGRRVQRRLRVSVISELIDGILRASGSFGNFGTNLRCSQGGQEWAFGNFGTRSRWCLEMKRMVRHEQARSVQGRTRARLWRLPSGRLSIASPVPCLPEPLWRQRRSICWRGKHGPRRKVARVRCGRSALEAGPSGCKGKAGRIIHFSL